jgi:hypothetical protein
VEGTVPPMYFGREGKDRFHETIMQEEDAYLSQMRSTSPAIEDANAKSTKGEHGEREAFGGIP